MSRGAIISEPAIEGSIVSCSHIARLYEVRPITVCDIVRKHGLKPKRMSNGRAMGLDRSDVRVVARALGQPDPSSISA